MTRECEVDSWIGWASGAERRRGAVYLIMQHVETNMWQITKPRRPYSCLGKHFTTMQNNFVLILLSHPYTKCHPTPTYTSAAHSCRNAVPWRCCCSTLLIAKCLLIMHYSFVCVVDLAADRAY